MDLNAKLSKALLHSPFNNIRHFFLPQTPAEVEVKQIEMAFLASIKNLRAGIVGVLLISVGIWSIPAPGANEALLPYLLAWAFSLIVVLSRGIYVAMEFERRTYTNDELIRNGRRLAANAVIAGILWGSSSFLILNPADPHQATFLTCSIGLVIMGGAGAQAQYGRLVNWFVLSATTMFVCGILANPAMHPLIALGFFLYATVALGFAHQQQASVKEIIELNLENERLLRQTRESMRELDKARTVAESANRAKTRFLAATSHDLRQPMHALSLYVAHLRQCGDRRERQDTLDKADAAMEAMRDLLDAVLDLSRISLGTIKPEIRCVELEDVLQRVRTQLQPEADANGLMLSIERFHGRARTDPVLLERIIRNIVLNAIRYTRSGLVRVWARRRGDRIIVRIADTGIGIPRQERAHVFEEFYQLDNPERDRQKGLGLGLAIVAQLGMLLSHPISLRSRVGRGTIFRIVLDASAEVSEAALPAVPAGDDFVTGSAVLVVDDDPMVLDSMVRTLQDMACHVITAGSALEALGKLGGEARIPDIIISDYRLKGRETGIGAIRMLRENIQGEEKPAQPIPGLIISGDTSPEEMRAVSRAGLGMLHKPLAPPILRAKLNELLGAYSAALCAGVERKP